jgi:hypothetical protein
VTARHPCCIGRHLKQVDQPWLILFQRYLLKLSGEALAGQQGFGHDTATLKRIAREVADCSAAGAQIAIVVGGGNIIRGARMAAEGGDRVAGDHMGMLGTLINGIALREAIREAGATCSLFCAFDAPTMCETFSQRAVLPPWMPAMSLFLRRYREPLLHHRYRCGSASRGDRRKRHPQGDPG